MKPILFNTIMVQAILTGRKTQTRRPIKKQPWIAFLGSEYECNHEKGFFDTGGNDWACRQCGEGIMSNGKSIFNAKYLIDDILYVRETWCDRWLPDGFLISPNRYGYKADGEPSWGYWGNAKQCKDNVWIPSIHMPKEAARIFLKVTDVRVERLNNMTENDAAAEGIKDIFDNKGNVKNKDKKTAFKWLWDSIYKEYPSSMNPWVFVYEFELVSN